MTNNYIYEVQVLANRRFNNLSPFKQSSVNSQLDSWKNARNKHNVDDYYSDPDFGLCYVKNLYKARVNSFYELLKHVCLNSEIKQILKESTEVMSICCGPGPDIAAYISYVRNVLQLPYQELTITGVDKLAYWEDYVTSISHLDGYSTISFTSSMVTSNFVQSLQSNLYHVCIMSYPQAVLFDRRIWCFLQQKFRFILVLDQAKYELHNVIKMYGFKIDSFEFVGTKRYFYWINKSYQKPIKSPGRFSNDGILGHGFARNADVQHKFECGHTATFKRDSYGYDIISKKCEKIVTITKNCGHQFDVKCGLKSLEYNVKCEKLIKMNYRKCGHLYEIKCCDQNTIQLCNTLIPHIFNCGHRATFKCYSYNVGKNINCESCRLRKQDFTNRIQPRINEGHNHVTSDLNSSKICGIVRICGHKCLRKDCYLGKIHQRCLELCDKKLKCGHFCHLNCHLGVFDKHICTNNCSTHKLNSKFFDLSFKRKWTNLLNRFQLTDGSLRDHVVSIITYMKKWWKFKVIINMRDEIYELLAGLLKLYTSPKLIINDIGLDRCKRLILFINVHEPHFLRCNITKLTNEMRILRQTSVL